MTSSAFEKLRNKRILVTGGAGFIGSHLTETLLAISNDICVFDLVERNNANNISHFISKITYVTGDVCNLELLKNTLIAFKPEVILHLAANASVPKSSSEPLYDFDQNAKGTMTLLEAIRATSPKVRLVTISSGAVYGDPGIKPISEEDPLLPISPYGLSKYTAEIQTQLYVRTFGLSASIARLFNCYGPRLPRFVVLDFLNKLKQNSSILEVLGNGQQTRDFTYVSDTVAGILTVAAFGVDGEAYNIASGTSHTVLELADALLSLKGLSETKIVTTGASWTGDAQHWKVSIQKANKIGYSPKVNLLEGLKPILTWYDSLQ